MNLFVYTGHFDGCEPQSQIVIADTHENAAVLFEEDAKVNGMDQEEPKDFFIDCFILIGVYNEGNVTVDITDMGIVS